MSERQVHTHPRGEHSDKLCRRGKCTHGNIVTITVLTGVTADHPQNFIYHDIQEEGVVKYRLLDFQSNERSSEKPAAKKFFFHQHSVRKYRRTDKDLSNRYVK